MTSNSSFSFIKDKILKENLDRTFQHIIDLLILIENTEEYNNVAKSSFRKTVIISTGSIVEALLFYILNENFSEIEIQKYYSNWELINKKNLYTIPEENRKIIAGELILKPSKTKKEKMNLGQICIFLKDKAILSNTLFKKIDTLRKLRNEQHLGTQKKVRSYTKVDLDNCFSVASDVKNLSKSSVRY